MSAAAPQVTCRRSLFDPNEGRAMKASAMALDLPSGIIKDGWKIPCKWRFLARKISDKWSIFQHAMLDYRRYPDKIATLHVQELFELAGMSMRNSMNIMLFWKSILVGYFTRRCDLLFLVSKGDMYFVHLQRRAYSLR